MGVHLLHISSFRSPTVRNQLKVDGNAYLTMSPKAVETFSSPGFLTNRTEEISLGIFPFLKGLLGSA